MGFRKNKTRNAQPPANGEKPTPGLPWALRHRVQILVSTLAAVLLALAAYLAFAPSQTSLPPDLSMPTRPGGKIAQTQSEQVLATAAPLMKARQFAPARDLMLAYVKTNPSDTRVRPMLAEALYRLKDATAAEHVVDDVIRLDPKSPRGLWLKGILVRDRKGENPARYFQWAAQSPQAGADIWVLYALELASTGKLDRAEEFYRKALKGDSRNVQALGGLGELLVQKGQFEEADKLLGQAVHLDKNDRDLWRMYAEAQKNLGKLSEASDSVAKALAIRRGGRELLLQGEILLLQAGKAQGESAGQIRLLAAETFASASDFAPTRAEGACKAAKVYYLLDQYAQAMRLIDLAQAAAPANTEIRDWAKKIEDARFPRPAASSTRPAHLLDLR